MFDLEKIETKERALRSDLLKMSVGAPLLISVGACTGFFTLTELILFILLGGSARAPTSLLIASVALLPIIALGFWLTAKLRRHAVALTQQTALHLSDVRHERRLIQRAQAAQGGALSISQEAGAAGALSEVATAGGALSVSVDARDDDEVVLAQPDAARDEAVIHQDQEVLR